MNKWAVPTLLLAMLAGARTAEAGEFRGLDLEQALVRLEARGLSVLYSSDLVKPGMLVGAEPTARDPRGILQEIVRPHGLAVAEGPDGIVMLVRQADGGTAPAADDAAPPPPPAFPPTADLDEIVVSASRYRLLLGEASSSTRLLASDIELLPAIGEDPVRSIERLPGVARQDFTSKPNVRGGVADETLVRFDGVRLYNPFHLKDFQSLFSTVDPGVVSGLTVYTAGFPVVFGDRMGSVIDIAPMLPGDGFEGRVGASVFNVGARMSGSFDADRGHWLASARRGNLDLVLDVVSSQLGDPEYSDYYARVDHRVAEATVISGSVLVFDDDLEVFDSDQEEEAVARYRDEYVWLRADFGEVGSGDAGSPETGRGGAGGRLQLVRARIDSERSGTADLPGVTRGSLDDRRSFKIDSLEGHGWWPVGARSMIQAGAEWRRSTGRYDYRDDAEFAELFLIPGAPQEPARTRELSARPESDLYAAYLGWRHATAANVTLDAGLRWEHNSLDGWSEDATSPRLSVLWQMDAGTRLRASWGRFQQAQGIDELQLSDGETAVFPAQRADHWVASLERRLGRGVDLRFEAYRKVYRDLRPRFENLLDTLAVLPELRPDRIRIDPAEATADGAELSLAFGGGAPLAAWVSYSWSSVRDETAGRSVRRSWDQTHFAGAGITHRGPRWEMSLVASWRSGWPTTSIELATLEPFPLVATGPRNDERLATYARLDARVARRFELGSGQLLTVFLDVSNLANRRNDCCVEYQIETEAGSPFLDVARRESLPLVPSLGFVWEF